MSLEINIDMLGNPSSEFSFSEREIHDLVTDDPDLNAEYWDFQSPALSRFANKIAKLYVVSNGAFTFQATWSGVEPSIVENLTIDEFIKAVKCNRIGTKTKYLVVGST